MSDVEPLLAEAVAGRREMSGVRAGGIIFVGFSITNLSNYVFHLLAARELGPSAYGDIATLTVISGIVTLPLAGAQTFVARHVAATSARGRTLNDDNYVSRFGGALIIAGALVTVILLAASPLIQSALSIGSLTAVLVTALYTLPSFVLASLLGALQGAQRFVMLAAVSCIPSIARVALAAVAISAGLGVAGTMGATLLSGLLALAIPLVILRRSVGAGHSWRPRLPRRESLALLPVVAGMLAITCLSSDDLVTAKVAFSAHEAGLYSSASLIGRVILYLPAAIITVLLPKVSARVSSLGSAGRIFIRCVVATALFCIVATVVYAAVPHLIVRVAFGSSYEGAAPLLWLFGVAMTLYALLNVLLIYRVGHGETRTCWLLLGGAAAQAVAFVAFHSSPRELLVVSICTGTALTLAALIGPTARSPISLRSARTVAAAER